VIKGMAGWPSARIDLTQPMLIRIWELPANVSPYDAMYVAATEQLLADQDGQAMLATADKRVPSVPKPSIPFGLFDPAAT
jgi:predicted nucleic acid-binding protein